METENTSVKKSSKGKYIIKSVIFVLICCILLGVVSRIVTVNTANYEYALMTSIYKEPEDSLDAVYIGSSNCFVFWNSLVAFEEYGITVLPFASNSQPINAAEYLIKEAVKTQPNSLYIVNVNSLVENDLNDYGMHKLLDYLPFSLNKLKLTNYITGLANLTAEEKAEYYFPLIRYHSSWNELVSGNFSNKFVDYKNSSTHPNYLNVISDVADKFTPSTERSEISDVLKSSIISLLDYIKETDLNVMFVTVPQARGNEEDTKKYNTLNDMIASYGYPTLDLLNGVENTGIDFSTDCYNQCHTNIHGSLKFTHYLAEYLVENYNFADKRNEPNYDSWNKAFERYQKYLDRTVLDFEIDNGSRDYTLSAAENIAAENKDTQNQITWSASNNAAGYKVYRKVDDKWSLIASTENLYYFDIEIEAEKDYTYTVVPFTTKGEEIYYGNFSYTGVSVSVS